MQVGCWGLRNDFEFVHLTGCVVKSVCWMQSCMVIVRKPFTVVCSVCSTVLINICLKTILLAGAAMWQPYWSLMSISLATSRYTSTMQLSILWKVCWCFPSAMHAILPQATFNCDLRFMCSWSQDAGSPDLFSFVVLTPAHAAFLQQLSLNRGHSICHESHPGMCIAAAYLLHESCFGTSLRQFCKTSHWHPLSAAVLPSS